MTQQPPHNPVPPPTSGPSRRANWIIGGIISIAAIFGLLVVLGLIVQAADGDGDDAASSSMAASSSSASAAPPAATNSSSTPNSPSTTSEAAPPPITSPPPQQPAARPPSDPRCAPAAPILVDLVAAGLTRAGWRLTNGTVITAGPTTYFGATMVDQGGAMKERSDVWVIRDGMVYASTGGARNNTTHPKASNAPLNISPGDELVQAVDACVIAATR